MSDRDDGEFDYRYESLRRASMRADWPKGDQMSHILREEKSTAYFTVEQCVISLGLAGPAAQAEFFVTLAREFSKPGAAVDKTAKRIAERISQSELKEVCVMLNALLQQMNPMAQQSEAAT